MNDEAPVVWTLSHIWVRRILWLKPGQTSEEINYNLFATRPPGRVEEPDFGEPIWVGAET